MALTAALVSSSTTSSVVLSLVMFTGLLLSLGSGGAPASPVCPVSLGGVFRLPAAADRYEGLLS